MARFTTTPKSARNYLIEHIGNIAGGPTILIRKSYCIPSSGGGSAASIDSGACLPSSCGTHAIASCGAVFWSGAEAFTETQKKRLLSPRLREKFADLTSWHALMPIRERFEQKAWEKSHLNWMTYMDLNLRLPELLRMRVDKMSMGVSLEGPRVPFLDHKFVELAMSIPEAVKIRGGQLKHILKNSVRGVIPDELIDRKKQGFRAALRVVHRQFGQLCPSRVGGIL